MSSSGYLPGQNDGDESAKALDRGATSAMSNTDLSSGIHEAANQKASYRTKSNQTKTRTATDHLSRRNPRAQRHREPQLQPLTRLALSASSLRYVPGRHYKSKDDGERGTAQKVGGLLSKDGAVGKQFTDTGSVGGTIQNKLGDQKKS
ncbi:hypothetical protein Hte_010234 [Hypoxylon texense]